MLTPLSTFRCVKCKSDILGFAEVPNHKQRHFIRLGSSVLPAIDGRNTYIQLFRKFLLRNAQFTAKLNNRVCKSHWSSRPFCIV